MPAYDYECKDCQRDFTIFLSIKEFDVKQKIKCPYCDSSSVHKKFTAFFAKTSKKS